MPQLKDHLNALYRVNLDGRSREGYMRLDMNEAVPGLPEEFVKDALSGIDCEFLATYPEYGSLLSKIALHNDIGADNICLSNGSDAAIKYIFDAYISPGDRVLMTNPTFAMYPVYCRMFNAPEVVVEYWDDLSFPATEFKKKLSDGIKLAVLVNPNNPTGSVLGEEVLTRIMEEAESNDVLLVVDEAYFYFYPRTVISRITGFKNLIVLRTFSKLCAIAALRLGYAAACPEIITNLKRVKPTFDVNALAVRVAERLLDEPDIMNSLIGSMEDGKRHLLKRLTAEGFECRGGHANFVLINCSGRVHEVMSALEHKKILVGGGFSQAFLKNYIRVTVGNKEMMEVFCRTFLDIWKSTRAKAS